jgi:hypothetical protein
VQPGQAYPIGSHAPPPPRAPLIAGGSGWQRTFSATSICTLRILGDGTADVIVIILIGGDLQRVDAEGRVVGIETWRTAIIVRTAASAPGASRTLTGDRPGAHHPRLEEPPTCRRSACSLQPCC